MERQWLVVPILFSLLAGSVVSVSGASASTLPNFTRVSVSQTLGDPDSASIQPSISHDGSLAVFSSYATNLVAVSVDQTPQVYATPLSGGATELISVNDNGEVANAYAQDASTSGAGRFVVFQSAADNLVPYAGSARSQVFIRDRVAQTTELVSVNTAGAAGNGFSANPRVSADGRYVVFWSTSTNLGGSPFWTIYLRDRAAGTTIMVPVDAPSGSKVYNQLPRISDDGSTVAFTSTTLDIDGFQITPTRAMTYSTVTGVTSEVSLTNSGVPAGMGITTSAGESVASSVSADGRYVVFHSRAASLKTLPNLPDAQVYVRDTVAGTTRLLSSENSSRQFTSAYGTISDDGQIAVYSSGLGNGTQRIVLHNYATGSVTTLTDTGMFWGSEALGVLDGSGRHALFMTLESLDPNDGGGADIYASSPPDVIPPSITASADRPANAFGWSPIGTTITWSASDAEPSSGLPTTPPPTVISTEGALQTITSELSCDPAGNCATGSYVLSVDATAPDLAATTEQASSTNWFVDDVTFTWNCNDELSGIATECPPATTIGGEGLNLTSSAAVSDRAGNTTVATTNPVNIDRTAPITEVSAPSGWTNQDLSLTFVATDNLSGLAETYHSIDGAPAQSGATATITGQGTHLVRYWSIDVAGNVESTNTATVRIEYDGPALVTTLSPAPNDSGWNTTPVTLTTTCTDDLSGIEYCTPPITISVDGGNQSVQVSGTDSAGNTSSRTVAVNIDTSAPIVDFVGVVHQEVYPLALAPSPSCITTDETSGVATAATLSASRAPDGTHTVTCAGAADAAGNVTPATSLTYRVVPSAASVLALTFQFIDRNEVRHPLVVKARASVLIRANTCAFINGVRSFGLVGTLTEDEVSEVTYWARVLSPSCSR